MPQRSRLRDAAQRVLNSVVASLLLLTTAVLSPSSPAHPPQALVTVDYSATAGQFATHLPVTVTFHDRMGTAVFAQLPAPLPVQNAVLIDEYRTGDIAYVASEQSIVVFLSDGNAVPDSGLMLLGQVKSGMKALSGCVRDCAVELRASSVS